MKIKSTTIGMLLGTILFALPTTFCNAQRAEISLGLGYTAVDLNTWAESAITDWNQLLYTINAQYYFNAGNKTEFGVELGYTYFFWYTVPPSNGLRAPSATSISGLLRYAVNEQLFLELTGGFYLFGDWTDPGLRASIGYMIPINDNLGIPLKFQAGTILDSTTNLYTVDLSGGLAYRF